MSRSRRRKRRSCSARANLSFKPNISSRTRREPPISVGQEELHFVRAPRRDYLRSAGA
jgi:hypothetical protein